eukprot:2734197-Pyramimonas_sp.AAC.1
MAFDVACGFARRLRGAVIPGGGSSRDPRGVRLRAPFLSRTASTCSSASSRRVYSWGWLLLRPQVAAA